MKVGLSPPLRLKQNQLGGTMSEQQVLPQDYDKKDAALEMFISERERVAAEWGIDRNKAISSSTLQGIDAEVNERLRVVLIETQQNTAALRASLAQSEAERERLRGEGEKLKSRRVHTQEWYASHYAKLEDWARKILPEPWRNQFFSCVANGTYSHKDVGEAYTCRAGFKVVPSGYIHMDDAKGQIIRDQTTRAEEAEAELEQLKLKIANESRRNPEMRYW
jgi:hypothetical protein